MAIRTALLNWNNINRDTDFSKYIETVSEPWVIEWLAVSSSSVAIWKARVPCERSNGDEIFALVYVTSAQSISGNGDVYIEVGQTYIDNWELSPEDWTGIATISVGTMPAKNALKLATITSGVVEDKRNMIHKLDELNQIIEDIQDLDGRVEALEEADAIDHLEESWLVWELYTLNDKLFKQYTPALADSTVDCNVGDIAANTQIHIQRIASWVESNQLKLKVKKTWSPTQNLIVEVRKWVQVTVTANAEAYWYGDQVVASGSIAYSSISTSYQELTVTLNNNFWGTKGELLDVVVYQNNSTVNASNYFCVACDSTQYSEWFSYVSVNGSTRTRSKLMPYCISDGFAQSLFVKANNQNYTINASYWAGEDATSNTVKYIEFTAPIDWNYILTASISVDWGNNSNRPYYINLYVWENRIYNTDGQITSKGVKNVSINQTFYVKAWQVIKLEYTWYARSGTVYARVYANSWNLSYNIIKSGITWDTKEIINLGGSYSLTIYWMDDWVYKWWIMLEKSSSANTWEITLWNAVGYISVNFNGEIIKIPYYS